METTQAIDNKDKSSDKVITKVTSSELPICCPIPEQPLWNQHPRVYIAFDSAGRGVCPYCGNQFQQTNNE